MKYIKFYDYHSFKSYEKDCNFIVKINDDAFKDFIDFVEDKIEELNNSEEDIWSLSDFIDGLIAEHFSNEAEILDEVYDYEIEF